MIRLPSVKSCRKFRAHVHEGLVRHMHWKRRDQQRHLQTMLRGFYQYFGLHHCQKKLSWVLREVQLQWRRTLRPSATDSTGAIWPAASGSNCRCHRSDRSTRDDG
ncbi:MAG: hypothetical protein ACREXY_01205 [Gammaproteobacteria bacterium]